MSLLGVVLACSAGGGDGPTATPGTGGSGAGSILPEDGGAGTDGTIALDAFEESTVVEGEVYAHSADTLYKLEPISKTVSVVAKFSCVDFDTSGGNGMWDIALDKVGNMFGTLQSGFSSGAVVQINKATAECTILSQGTSFPNSLTFVPAGTVDPNEEVLVGYNVDEYLRIDKQTGAKQTIGGLNPNSLNKTFESSGDIVSIIGDKTYLTAKDTNSFGNDLILEVDPVNGKALKVIGDTGFSDIWGLGYWGGIAYGFNSPGKLIQIDLTTGKGTNIPIANIPGKLSFYGAGVTTSAPVVVPK
jgi:hypothetical protein